MSYYSYIDTALRVIHINRTNEGGVERVSKLNEVLGKLKSSGEFKSDLIHKNIQYNLQSPQVHQLMVHECHHYWQSLFYPYLFYINFLEYHSLCLLRLQLTKYPEDKIKLGTLVAHPKIEHNLRYCSDKFRYYWDEKNMLQVNDKNITDDQKYDPDIFCLNDLIEDATTIFQFRVTDSKPDSETYFRWIQNPANKGYKKLYKFLMRRFSPSYAYHFIPILVQLSFNTTEPISMFMNLVNMTIHHNLFEDEYSDMDYSLMKTILKSVVPPVRFSVEKTISLNDMPVGLIEADFYQEVIDFAYSNGQSVHYPLSVQAKKHLNWIRENEKREETLLHTHKDNFKELLERYFPFAIHFNFLDQDARNTALLMSSPDYNKITIKGEIVDYKYLIKEQLNMQDTTMNLFYKLHRETPHQCNHENCPFYSMLLCTKWNSIPKDHVNCRFPNWFPIHYNYKLLPAEDGISRVTKEELKEYQEEFTRLFKEFSHDKFRYLFNDNHVTLLVGKAVISGNDYEYIHEFIEKILKGKSITELAGVIILEFDEYAEDERQIFEIPEIRTYMAKVYEKYPAFFYFLNFEPSYMQASYIFPLYVKYTHQTLPDGGYNVEIDFESFVSFTKELSFVIGAFANQQGMDITITLDQFFKHILRT